MVKLTCRVLAGAAELSLAQCLRLEYRIDCTLLRPSAHADPAAGIKAYLAKSPQRPAWTPPTLAGLPLPPAYVFICEV